MFNSTRFKTFRKMFSVVVIASFAVAPLALAHDEHGKSDSAGEKTVTGGIVDRMCYLAHTAAGEEHGKACGSKCIKNGGPVGIVDTGKAYPGVGEHKPMNDEL